MKVCMFVLNNCKRDSRVLKEAKTLVDASHDVRIVARWAHVYFNGPAAPEKVVYYCVSASMGVVIYWRTSLNNYYATSNKLYEYISRRAAGGEH